MQLTVERIALVVLVSLLAVLLMSDRSSNQITCTFDGIFTTEADLIHQAVASWRDKTGAAQIWSLVEPAPPATLLISDVPPGEVDGHAGHVLWPQALQHVDSRGSVYQFRIHDDTSVNIYYSVAGTMRSGDVHKCAQYNIILKGKARLTTLDVASGKETVREYGANDYIITPAGVPHMYEFLEDNYLLEWWDCPYQAWFYEPYRKRIREGLQ